MDKIKSLAEYDGPGRVITSYDKLGELEQSKAFVPTISLKSGISGLDDLIRDFRGGNLIIISGDEGEGKSSFCRTLTHNFSIQNGRCLWFSYEERPDEFMAKFGGQVPYFLLPAELEMATITWIGLRVKEAKLKYKTLHAVFIDHLHYLSDEIETGNLSNDLGRICRKLKLMAVEENIFIVLICHTNRSESAEEPSIRSLRDSGMIGKEADKVCFIWRNADDTSTIKVSKDRATGTKNKKVLLIKKGASFEELVRNDPQSFHEERLKTRRNRNNAE